MKPRLICVPVALQRYLDLPPVALRQRDVAGLIARSTGAELLVLSVDAPVSLVAQLESTPEKLARLVQPLRDDGLAVQVLHREGRPSAVVREVVEGSGADLLVIGSHSKRGPLDVGVGSTASALMRFDDVPVLLVRPTGEEAALARKLMVPTYPWVFPYP